MVYNKMPNRSDSCQQYNPCYKIEDINKVCNSVDDLPLAIAYVAWQEWKNVLCAEEGLCHGTIFSDLIKPFCGCNRTVQKRGCN